MNQNYGLNVDSYTNIYTHHDERSTPKNNIITSRARKV